MPFLCGAPKAQQKEAITSLTREREAAEAENAVLKQRLQKLTREQENWQEERAGWAQQREELLNELQQRDENLKKAAKLTATVRSVLQEEAAASPAVEVYVSAGGSDTSQGPADANAQVSTQAGKPDTLPEALALEGVLERLATSYRNATAELKSKAAQVLQLEGQLEATRQVKEQLEANAKSQAEVAEVRAAALESENANWEGLHGELQQELERTQAEVKSVLESEAQLKARVEQLQENATSSANQASSATIELQASQLLVVELRTELTDQQRRAEQAVEEQEKSAALLSEQALRHAEEVHQKDEELAQLRAEAQERVAEIEALQAQLLEALDKAAAAEGDVLAAQAKGCALEEELVAVRALAADQESSVRKTAGDLAAVTEKAEEQAQQITQLEHMLAETRARAVDAESALAVAEEALKDAQRALTDVTTQYTTLRKDSLHTSKQLSQMAKDHSKALDQLAGQSEQLTLTQQELFAAKAQLSTIAEDQSKASKRALELEGGWSAMETETQSLRRAHEAVCRELEGKRALLAAIARFTSASSDEKQDVGADEATTQAYYKAALDEEGVRLKVADAPLPFCGALLAAVVDSRKLSNMVLDMAMGQERQMAWEKVSVRVAALAAGLGALPGSGLRTLELTGWSWGAMGSGVAAPFLSLGSASSSLTCLKVDARLFDLEACMAIRDLLLRGLVDLKRPGGKGVLRLYCGDDAEALDEWYGLMIQHAIDPSPYASSSSPPDALGSGARPLGHASSGTSLATLSTSRSGQLVPSSSPSFLSTATSSSHATVGYGQELSVRLHSASLASVRTGGREAVPRHRLAELTEFSGGAPGAVDSDLSNEGLENHHMVVVMCVLLTCPHLRRLRLDGNQIGDAGARVLALALPYNSWLRELGLPRNSIAAGGVRAIAQSLEGNASLRRLDLSSQRVEGAGSAGAEAFGAMFTRAASSAQNILTPPLTSSNSRTRTGAVPALEDLNLSGNVLNRAGAAVLTAVLRAGAGPALRKLHVSGQGLDAPSVRALQQAGADRTIAVNVVP